MNKIKCDELFNPSKITLIDKYVFSKEYPWELLPGLKEYIKSLIDEGIEGFSKLNDDVLVGKNVKISPTATIIGPTIICDNVEIRPGAYIRGSVLIGEECVIGNSSELKNTLLMRHVQVPHYNYVGDSILGNYSHMGAGSICSNLRSDGKEVIIHSEEDIHTSLRKIGGILGDHADIGCGSVLNPGTVIGQNTQLYPLTMARGVYPENSIVKSTKEVVRRK